MSAALCGGEALSGPIVSLDVSRHYVAEKYYCQGLSRLLQVYPEDGKPEKALQVLRSLCQEDGLELATSSEQSEK